jgi:hypothetical protein
VKTYIRVSALQTQPAFIEGLARLAADAFSRDNDPAPDGGTRLCPANRSKCPCGLA